MVGSSLQAAAAGTTGSQETLLLPQAAACVRDSLCLPLPFTAAAQNNPSVNKAALRRALVGCPRSPFETAVDGS